MTEAEQKRAIYQAVDEEARAFLKDFAAVFGALKNPQGWTVDGESVCSE